MNNDDKEKWMLAYNRELLGKFLFGKAVDSIIDSKNFALACSYFKKGLDYVVCDCESGGWRKRFNNVKNRIFNDTESSEYIDDNYCFCKAFLLSYEEDKESLDSALRAILKYSYNHPDTYSTYINGKILLGYGCPEAAIVCFTTISSVFKNKALINYRLGRTKEQYLIDYGLDDIYNSFIENYSSGCCLRILKKFTKKHSINLLITNNKIAEHFISDSDDSDLQDEYENIIGKNQLTEHELPVVENFIQILKSNESLFLKPLNYKKDLNYYNHKTTNDNFPWEIMLEDNTNINNKKKNNNISTDDLFNSYDEDEESYEKYGGYNGYSDDIIDDVFDGDPLNTWNID